MPLGEFSSDDLAAEIWAMTEREEPNLTRAFLLALGSLLGISSIVRLTRMIDDGEVMSVTDVVSDALSQVTIPPESFAAVQESVMQQAGELTAAAVDVGQPYDGVAPRAMAASGNITAYLVRHVNDVVRENLRRIISDQVNGAITRSEALRRIRQEVGLLPQHAQAVQNLEANLLASGLSPAQVQARSAAYADRLLRYRAEMISRTETARAASVGQQEYWEQLADDSLLPPNTMRQWIVTPDEKLCDICGPMEHLLVPLDGFWELNNGDQVYYPTDSHPNCRCSMGLFFPDQLGKADPLGLQRWLAMRPTIVKHASHDQKSHGNWARGRSAVPPRPGTTPIPEGHIRLYHYTRAGADVIREQGLKLSESRGETYGEPNLVWASGQQPGEFKTYVEFSVPIGDPRFAIGKPTEISPDSDYEGKYVAPDGRAYNVSPEGFRSDVGFIGGIKPEEFIAVHEPWHHRYRYMVEEGMTDAVLAGDWDDLMNDPSNPDYGKAIRQIYADAGISKHAQHDQKSHGNWARGKAEEYQGQHAPPEDAAPLHDLLAEGTWFPDDVYTHPQFYVHGDDDVVAESLAAIREARGNPDALITVYRSVPPGVTSINTGDWVALSRTYAENHGAERDREYWDADREWTIEGPTPETSASGVGQWVSYDEPRDWPVLEAKVPARLILNGGNDLIEWGYWGPDAEDGEVVSKHANHDQKSHGNWARGGGVPGGSVVDGHWVPGSPPPGSNERGVKDWERGLELFKERPELFRAKVLADDGLPVPESEEPSYAPGAYDELSDPDDQSALITIGRAINQAWEGEITRAIALNKIDPGNPEELGGNSLVDTRSEAYQRYGYDAKPERGTWKELPDELFHVTTNLGALQEGGFKTRDQLASEMGENPAGLGGGVSDAISFTTDPPIVDAIVRGIHELREAVRDDTGPAAVERMKAEIASWDTADERDGRTGLSGTQKLLAENPSSMEERGEFYKSFSYFRQFNVPNRPDPLFFNPNYQAFADLDPAEVGVVTISPSVAGAKGWQVEGMGEWRTIPEAVEIVAAEARDGDGDGFVLDGTNQERPVSKHANHDQKSHGNWAKGADRFDPRPYIEWKGRGRTSARAAVFHLWADHSKIEPILDEIDLLEAGGEVKETANGMAAAFIQAKLQENNPLANEPAFYRGTRTDRIPEPGETFEMKVRSWGGSADDAHRFTSFGGRTDGVPVLYEVLPEDRKQFMVMDTTRWRWDENKLAEVVGGGKFRVVGTRKFGSTDTTVVQVVQEEGAIATPIVKHASHDQKSHGNWAKGKFVPNETGQKSLDLIEEFDWKSKGMLGAKPTYQKLAKAGKPVFPSQPGAGTRVFTKRAGELPGKAMARNEAGEMEVVDITISGPLRGGHQLSPKQTQFILDTLNKISPEFRPTHVRVDAGRTIGGGWYVHGQDSFLKNEIHISAWMIPGVLSIPEMDQIYRDDLEFALVTGKDLEDVSRWKKYIWTLQTQTTEKAWAHFEKTIIHETGHAVETRLWASHLSAEENWRSEVSSDWVYKSREFFNEHFHFVGNRDVAGAGRYRNGPGDQHYYLAATNRLGETALADSLDKRHEDEDRWAADARADSELFAEWFRFGVEGLPFPNGHIIDEFVGGLVDGDGDGFVLDGTDQERRA